MKVSTRRGVLTLHFESDESALLARVFDDLAEALDPEHGLDADDEVRRRLFPDGYSDDAESASEFRSLTEDSLRRLKLERVAQCRADLADGNTLVRIESEAVQRWLTVLNDVRLAIGTRLGISEDDYDADPGDDDVPRQIYYWLTAVQDSLVTAVL